MYRYSWLIVFALAGCVSIQMPEVAQTHPAHLDAERAPVPELPSVLGGTGAGVVAPALSVPESVGPRPHTVHEHGAHTAPAPMEGVQYTCPMHPEIIRDAPGECPICGMDLVPMEEQP